MAARRPRQRIATALLCFAALVPEANAQATDSTVVVLPDVEIEAVRGSSTGATAPFAVSLLTRDADDVAMSAGLSLSSTLATLPGVRISDRGHYALGERVVVRGMGWRSAFGVRGVQVLLDGVPLTLPDGQAVLDIVDPAFISRAEAVRGPSSTFWGNGSGGVLVLSTDAFRDSSFVRGRIVGASHGVRHISGEGAARIGVHRIHGFASTVHSDGFRDHSRGGFTRAGINGSIGISPRAHLRISAAAATQDVESPGGLTRTQYEADPQLADPRNVAANAGKESTQAQISATLDLDTRLGSVTLVTYGISRTLDNPLSFAYIDLNRLAGGARAQLQHRTGPISYGVGVDFGFQSDDRRNRNNVAGAPGAERSLDQRERVRNVSAFGNAGLALGGGLSVAGGLRADDVRFVLDDGLSSDGDQSGERSFSAVSPSLGVSYSFASHNASALLFANVSTAFETPTTTELVNQPDGGAGLNAQVSAQRTRGLEVGARGVTNGAHVDIAVFRLDVSDRLVPFQDESGRTFYLNAGGGVHRGIEFAVSAPLAVLHGAVQAAYTGSTLR